MRSSPHALAPLSRPPQLGDPPRLTAALSARLRAPWLDRQLATGAAPWRTPALAARALQLTSERNRRAVARSLERIVESSERSSAGRITAAVPVCRCEVREARPLILTIASRLRAGAPVHARGIAQLTALLSDGAGPFYVASNPNSLRSALEDAYHSLDTHD